MQAANFSLARFGVPVESNVISAHRAPEQAHEYAKLAEDRGLEVIIAAAGRAAHLAGVMAANTILPVIGVPIYSDQLGGADPPYPTGPIPPGGPGAPARPSQAPHPALPG